MAVQSSVKTHNKTAECPNCLSEAKLRERKFSPLAWKALLDWGEISAQAFNKPICDSCSDELREVLIDRHDEIDSMSGKNVAALAS